MQSRATLYVLERLVPFFDHVRDTRPDMLRPLLAAYAAWSGATLALVKLGLPAELLSAGVLDIERAERDGSLREHHALGQGRRG